MKQLMLGNAAVARGLYEAGCAVASSYPGTPTPAAPSSGPPRRCWGWSHSHSFYEGDIIGVRCRPFAGSNERVLEAGSPHSY